MAERRGTGSAGVIRRTLGVFRPVIWPGSVMAGLAAAGVAACIPMWARRPARHHERLMVRDLAPRGEPVVLTPDEFRDICALRERYGSLGSPLDDLMTYRNGFELDGVRYELQEVTVEDGITYLDFHERNGCTEG